MMFDWNKINLELTHLLDNSTFQQFVQQFKQSRTVGYVAHGGNLAIADHAAIDATRHTEKMCSAPGSGVVATSLFNEFGDNWQREWIARTNLHCYIVITATGSAASIHRAVDWLELNRIPHIVLTARSQQWRHEAVIDVASYHEFECAALAVTYHILEQAGYTCPLIS